ncbi:hypothetical protein LOD99_15306 [Oopsacas minuta]|uniref:Uncharacterized protein n=1 Tax=Oopsacas minuta TaxID=111878 RepID=A0AAV7KAP5_9METZ|nr:hypothetical protein LOD99_15306 [Oopsacas minuta]
MPTHHNIQWEPLPVPSNLQDNQLVFVMRVTGEILQTYEEYISRLHWYLDKNWICDRTGRSGLTLEQALESESTADKVVSYFPTHLHQDVLEIVQGNTLKLDQLIQYTFNQLANDKRAKLFISSYKLSFCKDVLRQFIRDNTYKRVSIPGLPYIVRKEIAEKHNLILIEKYIPKRIRVKAFANETPEQLSRRKENEKFIQTTFTVNISDLNPILNQLHNCNESKPVKITQEIQDNSNNVDLVIRCMDCGYLHCLSQVEIVESVEYPKPDEELTLWERAKESLRPVGTRDLAFSNCMGDLLFAWNFLNSMHEFIELSPFTFRDFEEALLWEREFPDEAPCVLLLETFVAIIRSLLRNTTGRLSGLIRHSFGGYKSVSRTNWETSIRSYIRSCIQVLRELQCKDVDQLIPFEVPALLELFVSDTARLNESCYKRLDITTKSKLLMFICDHVGMSHSFKVYVDKFAIQLHDTRSKLWEERSKLLGDNRNDISNGNADDDETENKLCKKFNYLQTEEIDRVIKRLNIRAKTIQVKMKTFSIEPLGQDREFRTYWHIPSIGYRIFSEMNGEWIYYDTKTEIEQLITYLNEKGERENVLKERMIKLKEEIFLSIENYFESLLLQNEVRRSTRMAAMVKHKQSFMSYLNSYLSY